MILSDYDILKAAHISAVAASFLGFSARAIAALRGDGWLRSRPARVLPHVIDTVLLLSALALVGRLGLAPWSTAWLRAKLVGLVLYIALGMLALRSFPIDRLPHPRLARAAVAVLALATFGYIVSVALTKSPWGLIGAP